MEKSMIIIGAGIAGLSAGCYGQMNGYRTQIFEMHTLPGGVCTTWKRKGYKIDGCIHWLTGSRPGTSFYRLWEELGVVQGRTMIDHEEYARIEGEEGKVFIVYSDINRLEQHMKELAPEDKDVIEEFSNGIRKMIHFPIPWEKAPKLFGPYDKLPLYSPLVYIGLGVARSFEEIPPTVTGIDYPLDEPITVGGQERKRLSVQIYNFDPSLAPAGKTFVRVMFASDYEYWQRLKQDPERYKAEKERIADLVVAALDRRFPGLAARVEMRDVATPMTWEHYTGNWRGSFQGWLETTKTLRMRMSKTLPGLKDFYMAGQWVEPGGSTPTAAMSGRNVTQMICKQDKKRFVTSTP